MWDTNPGVSTSRAKPLSWWQQRQSEMTRWCRFSRSAKRVDVGGLWRALHIHQPWQSGYDSRTQGLSANWGASSGHFYVYYISCHWHWASNIG